jgi:hypothetical protein
MKYLNGKTPEYGNKHYPKVSKWQKHYHNTISVKMGDIGDFGNF